jgi:Pyrimidine dimer DNA glycosylase
VNIFFLDWDVEKNAQYHCDKHVVKMVLETAQLLCGVHHMTVHDTAHDTAHVPYKLSHKNHPCSIWARDSMSNYLYLCEIGLALCEEYTYRYGKRHKSQEVIEWCLMNKPQIQDIGFTTPPKAMPDEYKTEDVIESYRKYYLGAKKTFLTWKERKVPEWVIL